MKLELFKNKKEFDNWLSLAVFSNYSEDVKEEDVKISEEFREEMKQCLKFTKKLPSNFKISFGPPILLALRDDNGAIVGTVSVRKDAHKSFAAQINNVAIHPNYRRQGLGKFMIDEIAKFVREHSKYHNITLTTDASRGFYQKIGMRLAGVLDFGKCTRYFFEKEIR